MIMSERTLALIQLLMLVVYVVLAILSFILA